MRVSHQFSAEFDDDNLIATGGSVPGMVAGADSISDMDLLRHGGMGRAFSQGRAPTTLGTHLRGYRFGHVRQLGRGDLPAADRAGGTGAGTGGWGR